ncbi:MAG: hypothetical protein Q8L07_11905 [Sediminibacterium sp.]|nr:hypothetical protein [Sediminibacterium sp.]MDP1811080.1 hypothetical protein [Sediminibacterium sp.]MDP3129416.1 hypothetical protein [Sediminibacterium sp.]MDP3666692.1 hypothetical protein [Sediminibacterium sp.]
MEPIAPLVEQAKKYQEQIDRKDTELKISQGQIEILNQEKNNRRTSSMNSSIKSNDRRDKSIDS